MNDALRNKVEKALEAGQTVVTLDMDMGIGVWHKDMIPLRTINQIASDMFWNPPRLVVVGEVLYRFQRREMGS